jgi:hypothetical protein
MTRLHSPHAARRLLTALVLLCLAHLSAHAGERLARIQSQGALHCGVSDAVPGFSQRTASGDFIGFEADLCRALAAAVVGTPRAVRFIALADVYDFLADARIDIVFHRLTWSLGREAPGQLEFGPVVFHDEPEDTLRQPLAPLLRSDDIDFARAVRWVFYALIDAEERGYTAHTVPANWPPASTADSLGLDASWAQRAVKAVGNYGELFDKHFGAGHAQTRPRGLNRLVREGGVIYAPPLN